MANDLANLMISNMGEMIVCDFCLNEKDQKNFSLPASDSEGFPNPSICGDCWDEMVKEACKTGEIE